MTPEEAAYLLRVSLGVGVDRYFGPDKLDEAIEVLFTERKKIEAACDMAHRLAEILRRLEEVGE